MKKVLAWIWIAIVGIGGLAWLSWVGEKPVTTILIEMMVILTGAALLLILIVVTAYAVMVVGGEL